MACRLGHQPDPFDGFAACNACALCAEGMLARYDRVALCANCRRDSVSEQRRNGLAYRAKVKLSFKYEGS